MPDTDTADAAVQAARARHWRRTRRLTGALLLAWFGVGFVLTWFARDLDFAFFGWPFSFWVAAQGAAIVFLALIAFHAWRMARLDRALARSGGPDDEPAAPAQRP